MVGMRSVLGGLRFGQDYDPEEMRLSVLGRPLGALEPGGGAMPPPMPAAAQAPPAGRDLSLADVMAPPEEKVGFGRKLGAMLLEGFGASKEVVDDVRHPGAKQRQAALMQARVAQARRLFPGDEQAQFFWVMGDEDFKKSLAERYKPVKLSEGDESHPDARESRKNVKTAVGVDGGYGYAGDAVNGVKFGDRRGPSHAESEESRHNQAAEEQDATEHADEMALETEKAAVDAVVAKAARQGYEALSPGEQRVFDAWEESKKRGSGFQFPFPSPGGSSDDGPARPPAGKPKPPASPGAKAPGGGKYKEGGEYVQNGWVYRYAGGKFTAVRPAAQ